MELEAAKMIGAGLAAIALAGAGVGIGIIFGNYLSGAEKSISCSKTISKSTFRFRTSGSDRFIWFSCSINYSICILVN